MKFHYKKLGANVLRPVIPVELLCNGSVVRYEALIDSGADLNIFPADLCELLNIDVRKGKKLAVSGITGGGLHYYLHPVAIRVGGWAFNIEAGFMPDMPSDLSYGVLGQCGFFDLFKIAFDYHHGEIDIKPYL